MSVILSVDPSPYAVSYAGAERNPNITRAVAKQLPSYREAIACQWPVRRTPLPHPPLTRSDSQCHVRVCDLAFVAYAGRHDHPQPPAHRPDVSRQGRLTPPPGNRKRSWHKNTPHENTKQIAQTQLRLRYETGHVKSD